MEVVKIFFAKRKSAAIIASISLVAVYEFSKIYVPEFVENRFSYRLTCLIEKLIVKMAKISSRLGNQTEPAILRSIIKRIRKQADPVQRQNIIIRDTFSNNVKIRIYSPKVNSDELLPAMIFYHGGGYVLCSVDDYDHILIPLTNELNIVIISIDYPLAPENKYPIPIEECYSATSYFLNNLGEYDVNIDINRIILAGDSAGANISTIISNKLLHINKSIPKLQALVYPPTQYFNFLLPSGIQFAKLDRVVSRPRLALWHMGLLKVEEYHEDALVKNYHTLLADEHLVSKYKSYLDITLIPEIYKKDKTYYNSYEKLEKFVYPEKINESSIIHKDKEFQSIVKNLFNLNISPGLADDEVLKSQPKTLMIVSECDSRKDESLIYAERLSRNGVSVQIAYHENGFHGSFTSNTSVGQSMRNDLVNFIKENL